MLQFFTSLESTSFATWLRESNTIWAYPTVLTLHTVGLALLVGASMALDLRLLGFAPRIPVATLSKSFRVMTRALVASVGANDDTPPRLKLAGAVSLGSWFAVLYFGRMLPFIGGAF